MTFEVTFEEDDLTLTLDSDIDLNLDLQAGTPGKSSIFLYRYSVLEPGVPIDGNVSNGDLTAPEGWSESQPVAGEGSLWLLPTTLPYNGVPEYGSPFTSSGGITSAQVDAKIAAHTAIQDAHYTHPPLPTIRYVTIYTQVVAGSDAPVAPATATFDGTSWNQLGTWRQDNYNFAANLDTYSSVLRAEQSNGAWTVHTTAVVKIGDGEDLTPVSVNYYDASGLPVAGLVDATYTALVIDGVEGALLPIAHRTPIEGGVIAASYLSSEQAQYPQQDIAMTQIMLHEYEAITFDILVLKAHNDYDTFWNMYRQWIPTHEINPSAYEDRNTASNTSLHIGVKGQLSSDTTVADATVSVFHKDNNRMKTDGGGWRDWWLLNFVEPEGYDGLFRVAASMRVFRKVNRYPDKPVRLVVRGWRL